MILGNPALSHHFIHALERLWSEEDFSALLTHVGRHVPEKRYPSLPSMDMLDSPLKNATSAERATSHVLRLLRQLSHEAGS